MRNYKSPRQFIIVLFAVGALLFLAPLILGASRSLIPRVLEAGERAALLSAGADLPARSLSLLKARLERELKTNAPAPTAPPKKAATAKATPAPSPTLAPPKTPEPSGTPPPKTAAPAAMPKTTPPPQFRGEIIDEDFSKVKGTYDLKPGALKNYTDLTTKKITAALAGDTLTIGGNSEPQVLIYHTHATEAFEKYDTDFYDTRNTWRSTDNTKNMVAVGAALAEALRAEGLNVIHDDTQHDYPSYNGAYERSAKTVSKYLKEYPSIKIVLDVHRDATEREGALVRPITEIEGERVAQLMIISGHDDGTLNIPNWRENLKLAAHIQRAASEDYPGIMRPIFFADRKYNFALADGSLLLEFGAHGNTLEQCIATAKLAGGSIGKSFLELLENDEEK